MDIYPSFEVAIAVITFVLGFVSARHHAQLSAARQLIASMDDAVAGTGGPSSRDQVTDLLELAQSGFRRDVIVDATIVAAAFVSMVITVLSLLGPDRGWLDETAAGTAMGGIAVGLAWLVTLLGTADAVAVRRGIDQLRQRTTVGLLSQAESSLDVGDFDEAIALASLAATRSPVSALAYLSRARARVEQAELEQPHRATVPRDAASDVATALELNEGLVAGMLDWLLPACSTSLTDEMHALWVMQAPPAEMCLVLRRRLVSHAHGAVRRDVLGRKGFEDEWTDAERERHIGTDLISATGIQLLRDARGGRHGAAPRCAERILGLTDHRCERCQRSEGAGDLLAAMNIALVFGHVDDSDPLGDVDLPMDHPWWTWVRLSRAEWLERSGRWEAARGVLAEDPSPLARLRERLVSVPSNVRGC